MKLREKDAASPDAVRTIVPLPAPAPGTATATVPAGPCAASDDARCCPPCAAPCEGDPGIAIVIAVGGARGGRPPVVAPAAPGGDPDDRHTDPPAAAAALGEPAPRRSVLPLRVASPNSRDSTAAEMDRCTPNRALRMYWKRVATARKARKSSACSGDEM